MKTKLLYIFTRTPLHVGVGGSMGAIDHPVQRERHTAFPVIPGAALKGVFAEEWTDPTTGERLPEGVWLFGSSGEAASAGALQFSEAKLLAFPIRSARGNFAWITSPLALRRYCRDGGMNASLLPAVEPRDDQALFAQTGPLALGDRISGYKIVLEEYSLSHAGGLPGTTSTPARPPGPSAGEAVAGPRGLGDQFKGLLGQDPVWREIANHLAIVSDGMLSFFTQTACEVAQHATIDADRGIARAGACFSQENVPSETLFYACLNVFEERTRHKPKDLPRGAAQVFAEKLGVKKGVFQFGADASTGLGLCTVELRETQGL